MKAININLEVPEWIDEEKISTKIKRIAERMVYPEKVSAEDVRKKEKERMKWLYSTLR